MGKANTTEKFPVKFKFQNGGWKINFATMINTLNKSLRY